MSAISPPIQVTFAPAWWRTNYGMTFTEDILCDPMARTEMEREQRRLLFDRFGDVGLGERDPQPHPCVDGAYGHRFMAALWGCDITYSPGQAPAAIALDRPDECMACLQLPDLTQSPLVRKFNADAIALTRRYGHCDRSINIGGPLNNAVSVVGEAILAACAGDTKMAGQVLMKMARLCLQVDDELVHEGVAPGTLRPSGTIGNCPVCMVSPGTYRRVVLPVDQWYRDHYASFSIHHCGVFHPYRFVYQPLRPAHLDIGWGSDLGLIRAAYPEVNMSLEIQARILTAVSLAELDGLISALIASAAPSALITHLWVAEVGPDVSDDVIRHLVMWPARTH
jgi:hypothetical protein